MKFRAALQSVVAKEGRGTQARISAGSGIGPSQINDIYKGRGYGSEETRRKIAKALGYEYEAFLSLGESILKQDEPRREELGSLILIEGFPHEDLPEHAEEIPPHFSDSERINDLERRVTRLEMALESLSKALNVGLT